MSKFVKRQVTAIISGTACNLNCDYCYRKMQGVMDRNIPSEFDYPVEHMLQALSLERLGGASRIVVIGGGGNITTWQRCSVRKRIVKNWTRCRTCYKFDSRK